MSRTLCKVGFLFAISVISINANSQTCLKIENLRGYSAFADQDYEMKSDSISAGLNFCYEGEHGHFDNNDAVFTRFGSSTWIWFNANELTEVAEIWTFDFANRKVLFARTRGPGALLQPTTGAYVGDITETATEEIQ